jgi:hypothetical protein
MDTRLALATTCAEMMSKFSAPSVKIFFDTFQSLINVRKLHFSKNAYVNLVFFYPEALDGAYFGTTFAHLFFLTYPDLVPVTAPSAYVPRVFGYRISQSGKGRDKSTAIDSKRGNSSKLEMAEVAALKDEVKSLKAQLGGSKKIGAREGGAARMVIE